MSSVTIVPLTKVLAEQRQDEIAALLALIPLVEYTRANVVAEHKGDRVFFGKWDHSLAVVDGEKIIGVLMAYERASEAGTLYADNALYISELAVDPAYRGQGIARRLVEKFFERSATFTHLTGEAVYMVQTNGANWNIPVLRLYEKFGFKKVGEKVYENRTDVVLRKG